MISAAIQPLAEPHQRQVGPPTTPAAVLTRLAPLIGFGVPLVALGLLVVGGHGFPASQVPLPSNSIWFVFSTTSRRTAQCWPLAVLSAWQLAQTTSHFANSVRRILTEQVLLLLRLNFFWSGSRWSNCITQGLYCTLQSVQGRHLAFRMISRLRPAHLVFE